MPADPTNTPPPIDTKALRDLIDRHEAIVCDMSLPTPEADASVRGARAELDTLRAEVERLKRYDCTREDVAALREILEARNAENERLRAALGDLGNMRMLHDSWSPGPLFNAGWNGCAKAVKETVDAALAAPKL